MYQSYLFQHQGKNKEWQPRYLKYLPIMANLGKESLIFFLVALTVISRMALWIFVAIAIIFVFER